MIVRLEIPPHLHMSSTQRFRILTTLRMLPLQWFDYITYAAIAVGIRLEHYMSLMLLNHHQFISLDYLTLIREMLCRLKRSGPRS